MKKLKTSRPRKLTGKIFDTLPSAEKERIYQEFEQLTPRRIAREFRPLTARERTAHMRPRNPGRPKVGKAVKIISPSVEKDLLRRADAYARRHGMKRTELVVAGLKLAMSQNAA